MNKKGAILIGEPMGLLMARKPGPLSRADSYDLAACGAELNVAIGLKRLGHPASYMTKLGRDPFGSVVLSCIRENGIGTELISYSDDHTTGFMLKGLALEGDPEIFYYRKGSAASTLSPADVDCIDFSSYRLLHMTGILPPLSDSCLAASFEAMKQARKAGLMVTFDPNLRPQLWKDTDTMVTCINQLALMADIVFPGVKEGLILTGSSDPDAISDFYLSKGVKAVITKVGSKGAYVATPQGRTMVPGFHVDKVVDTVGAGDGFAAGCLSAILEGASFVDAARRGNAVGAIQVTVRGDNNGLPTPGQLQDFIASH